MRLHHWFKLAALALLIGLSFSARQAEAQLQKTVALLKGDLSAIGGDKLSGATISIYKGDEKVLSTRSNEQGKFTSVLQPGSTYRLTINHPMYVYSESTVSIPESEKYVEVPFHASVKPLHDGKAYDIAQPIFNPGSAKIEESAMTDFQEIVTTIKHNPKLTLSVTVYPDQEIKGGKKDAKQDVQQQQLLRSRASAIASFFLTSGISDKTVEIVQSKTVPAGRFPQTVVVTTGKKKKPQSTTVLIPQYAEIVTHLS